METFPDDVLSRILAGLPAEYLILVCRLVCSQWRNLVDGVEVWRMKCQEEGFADPARETETDNWRTVYFLSKKKRNLIKNNSGQADFEFDSWETSHNGGDSWALESIPGDNGQDFPEEDVKKYFVTSFEWCSKFQIIDLVNEGYWEELLDIDQPDIVVRDWYAARSDAGCLYQLHVKLLSENQDIITEYKSEMITIPQFSDASWNQISHTFSGYGPGVRFVWFEHGGQDTIFWKGWYGVRVTNSSVTVEP
ncbi:F-box only protein 2 [Pelodytes ibericus]